LYTHVGGEAGASSSVTLQEFTMKSMKSILLLGTALGLTGGVAQAASDRATTELFRHSDESGEFFKKSYGYAVFPTIGKGGLGIGAAHGSGHVYDHSRLIGDVTMNQLSIGFQAGGQGYSQIIFFADKNALDEFTSGNFEFSADVGAIAITAAASASAGTKGADASASAGKHEAATAGEYSHGMAVFTIAKGGLMYNATVAGQKFNYHKR
jgi:lipid-binding SYLF domain-containing protein